MATVTIKPNQADNSLFDVSGQLNQQTVPSLSKKQLKQLVKESNCRLDFSQVTHVDTAGLAWVLLFIESAQQHQCEINLINLPQDMIKLAQLSGLDTVFANLVSTTQ